MKPLTDRALPDDFKCAATPCDQRVPERGQFCYRCLGVQLREIVSLRRAHKEQRAEKSA